MRPFSKSYGIHLDRDVYLNGIRTVYGSGCLLYMSFEKQNKRLHCVYRPNRFVSCVRN